MTSKIILVGPTAPFRGGISQYNTSLFRELRVTKASHVAYSFSRQYPRWLYPGQSDIDPSLAGHAEPGVVYGIDSINPATWLRTARQIAAERPQLVVFHWWTVFWAPCFISMFALLKRRGIRTAFICHNLTDHDSAGVKVRLSNHMLAQADAYLVHSSEHAEVLARTQPEKPISYHPLPVFDHYPTPRGALPKRGRLELLFFGFIRPYKGLDLLIEALRELHDEDVFLTVVGEPWGDQEDAIRNAARSAPNVELHLSYTSAEDVAEFFGRADIVVLPYRTATGSAVAAVAQHYERAMLATRVGGLPDVVIQGRTGILVPPGDSRSLAGAIGSLTREQAGAMALGVRDFKLKWSWSSLAAELLKLSQSKARAMDEALE